MAKLTCNQCQGPMIMTTKAEHNFTVQIFAVIIFIIGLCLLFIFPIGTIIGLLLMIGSARMGYSKKKIWKCQQCGYFFQRA